MSCVNASAAIYDPRANEMRLATSPNSEAMFLTVSDHHVWFTVGTGQDLVAEAEAMERLAELASQAAARLRVLAAQRSEVAA